MKATDAASNEPMQNIIVIMLAENRHLTSPRSSKRRSRSNLPINLGTRKFRVFQTIFLERETRKILNMV